MVVNFFFFIGCKLLANSHITNICVVMTHDISYRLDSNMMSYILNSNIMKTLSKAQSFLNWDASDDRWKGFMDRIKDSKILFLNEEEKKNDSKFLLGACMSRIEGFFQLNPSWWVKKNPTQPTWIKLYPCGLDKFFFFFFKLLLLILNGELEHHYK